MQCHLNKCIGVDDQKWDVTHKERNKNKKSVLLAMSVSDGSHLLRLKTDLYILITLTVAALLSSIMCTKWQ